MNTERRLSPSSAHDPGDAASSPSIYQPLRWTFGLVPLLAGLDKFFDVLVEWETYLNPAIAEALPVSASTFMGLIGVVEIAAGLLVLSRFTRLGAYVVAAWLTLIAIQLVTIGRFDIAVRDLVMAVAAYTLARLAEARATVNERHRQIDSSPARPAAPAQPARS